MQLTFTVPDMTCEHCEHAVSRELLARSGVTAVEVDLATKLVTVRGDRLDEQALRGAIAAAGYDADER